MLNFSNRCENDLLKDLPRVSEILTLFKSIIQNKDLKKEIDGLLLKDKRFSSPGQTEVIEIQTREDESTTAQVRSEEVRSEEVRSEEVPSQENPSENIQNQVVGSPMTTAKSYYDLKIATFKTKK
jgi:hypothetical protein